MLMLRKQFANIPSAWQPLIAPFIGSAAYNKLCQFIEAEQAAGKVIYPADPFYALRLVSPQNVKVIILGQDPYHGEKGGIPQAHGLAFSVPKGVPIPPSLRNIFLEIQRDLGFSMPSHGCLESWAKQGVLLLNTVWTVQKGQAGSHANYGWEILTHVLLQALITQPLPRVMLLWGAYAKAQALRLDAELSSKYHRLLYAPHPSPLSAHRGFLGCAHFSQANQFLSLHGMNPIDWRLD